MSEERWRSVPWLHGASWERARSVGRTAEKHIRNVCADDRERYGCVMTLSVRNVKEAYMECAALGDRRR